MTLPPGFVWSPLVPELIVSDLDASLDFWRDIVGFRIVYDRPEDRFAYLELGGAQVMLEQRDGVDRQWITGLLEQPFGRGINFQITVPDVDAVLARLAGDGRKAFMDIEDKWYRAADCEVGVRQFLALDPDGYLLRLSSHLGRRPISGDT